MFVVAVPCGQMAMTYVRCLCRGFATRRGSILVSQFGVFFLACAATIASADSALLTMNQFESAAGGPLSWGIDSPAGFAVCGILLMALCSALQPWKFAGDSVSGMQTPDNLKVFAAWARQQIEDASPETHRQMLDDVISTFANYAQRLQKKPAMSARRQAVMRMRVLIDLLETPDVNRALRAVNWAWLREWDIKLVDPHEARQRCTVIFPTIIMAASVQQSERLKQRASSSTSAHCWSSHGSLDYLAGWCADFLDRPDVRAFVDSGESTPGSIANFMNAAAVGEDIGSSDDEDDSPVHNSPGKARQRRPSDVGDELEFERRTHEDQDHCWDGADGSAIMVRGARYLVDGVKIKSQPSMLEIAHVDLFKSSEEVVHYTKWHMSKILAARSAGDSRFYFVLNFRLPPLHFVIIWAVPTDADWHDSPEGKLFRKFCTTSDAGRNQIMKVLPKVTEGPWLVKKGVPDRPGVVGRKLAIEYFLQEDHIEVSINCISSPAGRRIVQLLTGAAKHFAMELFVILEGQSVDELPERALGGIAVFHGNLPKVPWR